MNKKFKAKNGKKSLVIDSTNNKQSHKPKEKTSKKMVKKVKGWIGPHYVESIIYEEFPSFLCYDNDSKALTVVKSIETVDSIYIPLNKEEHGYEPYSFSEKEFEQICSTEITKDSLLEKIKNQVDQYISADDNTKHLVLINLCLTYCQEWISTIHYPFIVGETETGKSSILHLFRNLAYRCLYGVEIPKADIYNFLGQDEEGAGTIAEDEAHDLAWRREKLRIYKNSYAKGSIQPIVDVKNNRKQLYYKTFCFKIFAGERTPEDKGFEERLAVVHMVQGIPNKNIKKLEEEDKETIRKLRNKLLVWKVKNIENGLEKIDCTLKGRDKELWEDFLRVADGTEYAEKAKKVVTYFTTQRHEKIHNSLEAKIFKIVAKLIHENKVVFLELWNALGDSEEFGFETEKSCYIDPEMGETVSKNRVSNILEQKFHGVKNATYETIYGATKKVTRYIFKPEILYSMAEKYNVEIISDEGTN